MENQKLIDNLRILSDIKEDIKEAIINKGVSIQEDTPFTDYANKISDISSGSANLGTLLTTPLYINGMDIIKAEDYEGIDGWNEARLLKPETLVPENIKSGVEISGVIGNYGGSQKHRMYVGVVGTNNPLLIKIEKSIYNELVERDAKYLSLRLYGVRPGEIVEEIGAKSYYDYSVNVLEEAFDVKNWDTDGQIIDDYYYYTWNIAFNFRIKLITIFSYSNDGRNIFFRNSLYQSLLILTSYEAYLSSDENGNVIFTIDKIKEGNE